MPRPTAPTAQPQPNVLKWEIIAEPRSLLSALSIGKPGMTPPCHQCAVSPPESTSISNSTSATRCRCSAAIFRSRGLMSCVQFDQCANPAQFDDCPAAHVLVFAEHFVVWLSSSTIPIFSRSSRSNDTISPVSRAVLLTRGIAGFRALRFVPIRRLYPLAVVVGARLDAAHLDH
jgi:hypothetical protein